jgi:hypothetical protein
MSRLISNETPGTIRTRLLKLTYFTSRELIKQNGLNNESKDMAAFIVFSLTKISELVDQTAKAWEDRNYWSKSDLFRKEWTWVSACKEELEHALLENDWPLIVNVATAVLSNTQPSHKSTRFSLSEPWQGSWMELQSRHNKKIR